MYKKLYATFYKKIAIMAMEKRYEKMRWIYTDIQKFAKRYQDSNLAAAAAKLPWGYNLQQKGQELILPLIV